MDTKRDIRLQGLQFSNPSQEMFDANITKNINRFMASWDKISRKNWVPS